MKVVFINRYFWPDHSATSQMLTDLAFHLARRGATVHVVTSRLRYDDPGASLPAREIVEGISIHRVWTTRFGRHLLPLRALDYLTFYPAAMWRLWRLVAAGDIVVAKTDPPLISIPTGWVCRWRGARLVNWLQDLFPEVAVALGVTGFGGWFGRWLVGRRNASLASAAGNVVIGRRMRDHVIGQGIPSRRVAVIPNWAELNSGEGGKGKGERGKREINTAEDIRVTPGVNENGTRTGREETGEIAKPEASQRVARNLDDKFVVGYSGNLGRAHETATLLGAMERLREEPDIVFLMTGGGAGMTQLRAEVERLGLANVRFEPYQPRERLGESLAVADVHLVILRPELEGLIVPSKFYGVAAAGRPVIFIGAPDGEIACEVIEGDLGHVIETGDSTGLADTISELADDPKRVAILGRNARATYEANYTMDLAMHRWLEMLETLK